MRKISAHPTKRCLGLTDWLNIALTLLLLPVFIVGLFLVLIWAGCEEFFISLKKKLRKKK
tara:strand:+ start:4880 stop:5059 length:180 start_codon:yes stop_codon:yes gene_type:complete